VTFTQEGEFVEQNIEKYKELENPTFMNMSELVQSLDSHASVGQLPSGRILEFDRLLNTSLLNDIHAARKRREESGSTRRTKFQTYPIKDSTLLAGLNNWNNDEARSRRLISRNVMVLLELRATEALDMFEEKCPDLVSNGVTVRINVHTPHGTDAKLEHAKDEEVVKFSSHGDSNNVMCLREQNHYPGNRFVVSLCDAPGVAGFTRRVTANVKAGDKADLIQRKTTSSRMRILVRERSFSSLSYLSLFQCYCCFCQILRC